MAAIIQNMSAGGWEAGCFAPRRKRLMNIPKAERGTLPRSWAPY
jgi:hypothetical protein